MLFECRLILKQLLSLQLICQYLYCLPVSCFFAWHSNTSPRVLQLQWMCDNIFQSSSWTLPPFQGKGERDASFPPLFLGRAKIHIITLLKEILSTALLYLPSTTGNFTRSMWRRGSEVVKLVLLKSPLTFCNLVPEPPCEMSYPLHLSSSTQTSNFTP